MQDYWRLIFTGGAQHYMVRHFAVLFDGPLSGACGLKLENLDVWGDPPPARVTLIDCDLVELSERAVSADLFEELP